MASGITNKMRYIRPRPPEWVKRHAAPSRRDRRWTFEKDRDGNLTTKRVRRPVMLYGSNEPYVNLTRDLQRATRRKGATIRPEAVAAAVVRVQGTPALFKVPEAS